MDKIPSDGRVNSRMEERSSDELLRAKTQISRTNSDSTQYNKDNHCLKITNRNDRRRRSVKEHSNYRKIPITQNPNRRAHSWDAAIDGGLDTEARLVQLLRGDSPTPARKSSKANSKLPLEELCLHCKFMKDLDTQNLKNAIEMALRDLALTGQTEDQTNQQEITQEKVIWQAAAMMRKNPDIIVSSVSSEDGSVTDNQSDSQTSAPPSPCPSLNFSSSSSSLKDLQCDYPIIPGECTCVNKE